LVIVQAFLALAGGLALLLLLAALFDRLVKCLAPGWAANEERPDAGLMAANLGWSFLSGAAGGYLTAWLGASNPLYQALVLAIIVLVLAAVSAMQARGKRSIGYALALVAISPVGVVAGALIRLRVLGVL
jgi:hypothetical protein